MRAPGITHHDGLNRAAAPKPHAPQTYTELTMTRVAL
jgi:hypothetical protein